MGRARNEIDFILVRKNQRNLVNDVSVINNFKFSSDHRLLRMSFNLKVKPFFTIHKPVSRIMVQKDKNKIDQFNANLKLHETQLKPDNVQTFYDNLCEVVLKSAAPFHCKKKSESIMSSETKTQIELREEFKRKRNENEAAEILFKAQRKKTNRMIRRDVHKHNIQLVEDAISNGRS